MFTFQVCLHMFTLDFLNQVANGLEKDSVWDAFYWNFILQYANIWHIQ